MVAISVMIEGQQGLTWPRWKKLVGEVEALGFAGLFRSDHFTDPQPPDRDALEMIVSLTYLAAETKRIHFGPLVAPVSFRDPIFLARQASAIDDLSGGRMYLGVGAGWQDREHSNFGYALGDIPTRMARFEEALEVITRLLRSNEPVTFEGKFYHLHDAVILPRPQRAGGPTILIGGNGKKRTLSLVAKYANVWNGVFLSAADFKERSEILDEMLEREGRSASDVKRTMMNTVFFGSNEDELERRVKRANAAFADKSLKEIVEVVRGRNALIGTPEQVIAQVKAYQQVGVEELMLQWLNQENIEGLHEFAESILPHV